MSESTHGPGTFEDAALVRYLDREATGEERARIDEVIATDATVAARLDALRRRTGRLRALLEAGDLSVPESLATHRPAEVRDTPRPPGPGTVVHSGARVVPLPVSPPRQSRAWLRAAIVMLLLGAAMLAVPPVRGWIIDGLQRMGVVDAPPSPPPSPAVRVDTLEIAGFAAAAPFTIELEHAQAAGRLTVRIADIPEPVAELRTQGGGESPLVLPEGLRIQNHETSVADYAVTLPLGVRSVRVRVGALMDTTWSPAGPAVHVFELRRRGP